MYHSDVPQGTPAPDEEAGREGEQEPEVPALGPVGELALEMLERNPKALRWLRDPRTAWMVTDHLAAFLDGLGRGWDGVAQPAGALGNDHAVQVRQEGVSCDLATALRLDRAGLARLVGDEGVVERLIIRVQAFLGGVVTGMRVAEELRREDAGAGGGEA